MVYFRHPTGIRYQARSHITSLPRSAYRSIGKAGMEDKKAPDLAHLCGVGPQFERLLALKLNWDGEGAKPVSPELIREACEFLCNYAEALLSLPETLRLQIPRVVPRPLGSLDLVWDETEWKLLLNIDRSSGQTVISYYGEGSGSDPIRALEGTFPVSDKLDDPLIGWLRNLAE